MAHREQQVRNILAVLEYQYGENSCNSMYVGGIDTAVTVSLLGGVYGKARVKDLVRVASDQQIDSAAWHLRKYITFMKKHPTGKCPHCGQVISAGRS